MNYCLKVCLSVDTYDKKPTEDVIKSMRFECCEISIDDFCNKIKEGHSFTSLMKNNKRNKNNFECTSMLVYDIDHCDVPMDDYVDGLDIKPTIGYLSPSNKEGDYRFRLIYCLNFDICSLDDYYTYSKSFAHQMGMKCLDEHSHYGEQYWNGNKNCNIILYNNILNIDNIKYNNEYKRYIKKTSNNKSITHSITLYTKHNSLTDTFIKDYWELSYQELFKKYYTVYPNLEKTPIELDEDVPIVKYPTDYYEIRRPWQMINGDIRKIKDGENRRRKLYLNGIIRRKINKDISFNNLLFNLVYEFQYYYINDGNKIDKKILYMIAESVMKTEINESILGRPKYKSFVNPLYCEKYNLSKKEVLGKSKNKKQYIGDLYDELLTDEDNIKVMKEYGLDISVITLKRWRKENKINKYKK